MLLLEEQHIIALIANYSAITDGTTNQFFMATEFVKTHFKYPFVTPQPRIFLENHSPITKQTMHCTKPKCQNFQFCLPFIRNWPATLMMVLLYELSFFYWLDIECYVFLNMYCNMTLSNKQSWMQKYWIRILTKIWFTGLSFKCK